ncbi:PD40 domain-containing protein [Salipiger mangrovisoli]|uniref:PD40 domain-containing protein n=1 Tax=Salipiger mangrovisoli TaxID=2865933 RepID=A0ABR9X5G6_9RHOB|nr:PD40 domain-containing protein [Salipiger mangrovisoli]MBE9638796.1 PD40 domain-containing protein [Salipiger mangrovisoli]
MATQLKVVSVDLVSTDSDGVQGDKASSQGHLSADGTWLVFQSSSKLVPEDVNTYGDVYLKNLTTGVVERLTVDPSVAATEEGGWNPAISADGTRVAFGVTYLYPPGSTFFAEEAVAFKDLLTGEDMLVSSDAQGMVAQGTGFGAQLSPDGTQVAFLSDAKNLVPGVDFTGYGVFLKDIASGAVSLISSSAEGEGANGSSADSSFSPDGATVAFFSRGDNLIEDDGNGVGDVFIKDFATGTVTRVSVASDGTEGNGESSGGAFSADGTKLLFASRATNLVAHDGNGSQDLFIKDLITGAVEMVTTDNSGNQWIGDSYGGVFSPDGTKIAFFNDTTSLSVRDSNGEWDIFVKDLITGTVTAVSTNVAGEIGDGISFWHEFLPDGSGIVFTSAASNLVADDTNGGWDVFISTFEEQELGEIVQWSEAEGGNGHWYQYVEGPLTRAEAKAEAESRSHLGLPGYLATITSAEENDFILAMTPPNVWAGGTDERAEGVWEWATGPEAGDVFWTRSSGALGYADWGGYEPNNAWSEPPGEDYLTAHSLYATGTWADSGVPPNPNQAFGYVVEYSDLTRPPAQIGLGRTEAEAIDIDSGFRVQRNPWASEDAFLQVAGRGEAVASGGFSGAAGVYTIIVGYFDEADGASSLRFEVNGETLDAWVWDADPAGNTVTGAAASKRVIPFVTLETGDMLTLAGTADGGEPLRTDYIDIRPAPAATAPFNVEAETLEITKDFQIFTNPHASGDAYLQAGGGPDQRALYDFDGAAGLYDLTIGYFDESDGVSRMSVWLNGAEVDSWLWDGDFGDAIVTPAGAAQHTLFALDLAPGDRIELIGRPDGGEPLRTDYLHFDPLRLALGAEAFLFT